MKILYVLDNLSIASGVSSIVMNLYRNMDRDKIQMDFLVCTKQEKSYQEEIEKLGGKVFYTGNFLSPNQIFSAISNSRHFFKEHSGEYDVVHLHSPTIAMFTLKYAKKYGVPIRIVHSHSTMMSVSKLKNIVNTFLISQIKKYANSFFACSTEAAHFLYGEKFCKTHKIELIHNAVDCSRFAYSSEIAKATREKYGICDDDAVFVNVSNYSPIKNHKFLTDVIQKFKASNKNVKFLFVGDGPTKQQFEEEIKKRDLENLCIFVDKTDRVNDYLCAADAAILPSIKEGLPLTLVESQASGLPFFASDTVTREVCVGQGEFLPLNANEWYKKLNAFKPLSEEERKNNSEMFKSSAFNIYVEAERVWNLYKELTTGEK